MSDPNVPRDPYAQSQGQSQGQPQGYVQPAYPNPVYVQPVYAVAPPRGMSIASLVIGIISFFFGFTVVLPLVGVILGFSGLRREPAGRGMAIAGIWINGLILVFSVIVVAVIVLAFLGAIGAVSIPLLGEIANPSTPA